MTLRPQVLEDVKRIGEQGGQRQPAGTADQACMVGRADASWQLMSLPCCTAKIQR
jgi:hypothetical protein